MKWKGIPTGVHVDFLLNKGCWHSLGLNGMERMEWHWWLHQWCVGLHRTLVLHGRSFRELEYPFVFSVLALLACFHTFSSILPPRRSTLICFPCNGLFCVASRMGMQWLDWVTEDIRNQALSLTGSKTAGSLRARRRRGVAWGLYLMTFLFCP